ncbi:Scr1 family TA system antitoxin-like transcriptional regulator [Streptomyces wuyuanensis]|uniref:DUF5753 domain-containing protein n=1 Tax=Streptomyces wuyuanensis TaxID=1196353 RepID=A0A1G9X7K9_9ACTN|nr:hypothetical protein SAMN05444921_115120 [Streptomyces wuyuanensis]
MYEPEEIDRHVEARLERQDVLDRRPKPIVAYVIEESVLHRPIGGGAVLKEQLAHLLGSVRTRDHLTVQVMPMEREVHAGLSGPMQLLSTRQGAESRVYGGARRSYVDLQAGRSQPAVRPLRGTAAQALTPWESVELIERMAARP